MFKAIAANNKLNQGKTSLKVMLLGSGTRINVAIPTQMLVNNAPVAAITAALRDDGSKR